MHEDPEPRTQVLLDEYRTPVPPTAWNYIRAKLIHEGVLFHVPPRQEEDGHHG